MARYESDRDDLFAELKTYVPRWEFRVPQEAGPVTVGLREDGRMAIYFSQDPCFHFDAEQRLLRAFVGGEIYRTQGNFLARLQRRRSSHLTELVRTDLRDQDLITFLESIASRMAHLARELAGQDVKIVREIGSSPEWLAEFLNRLAGITRRIQLAPAYPTRRR